MTLYLVVADDPDGENKDLFVMADDPREAVNMMMLHYEHSWVDFDQVRVFPVPMPLKKGPIDWPNSFTVTFTGVTQS